MTEAYSISKEELDRAAVIVVRSSDGGTVLDWDLPDGVVQICMTHDESLEILDEAEMNRHGWYRK